MSPACGGQGWSDVVYGSGISQVRVDFFVRFWGKKTSVMPPPPLSAEDPRAFGNLRGSAHAALKLAARFRGFWSSIRNAIANGTSRA